MEVIQQINSGQVFKNYEELCFILGQKKRGGKSKQLQVKDWKRYFSFHNQGRKIIIDTIYEVPKEKIDGRVNNGANNSKYSDLMDNIILSKLVTCKFIEASKTELYKSYIPLFTNDYDDLFIDTEKFAEKHSLGKGIAKEYLSKTNYIVSGCTDRTLDRLQKQNKIKWSLDTLLKVNPADDYYADERMLKLIEEKEKQAYKELDITPFSRVNIKVNKKFKELVCDYLSEYTGEDIFNYWKVYDIRLIKPIAIAELTMGIIKELKLKLAKSVCESVMNKKMTNAKGEVYLPYSKPKYKEQLQKLNQLVFGIKLEPEQEKDEPDTKVQSIYQPEGEGYEYYYDESLLPF